MLIYCLRGEGRRHAGQRPETSSSENAERCPRNTRMDTKAPGGVFVGLVCFVGKARTVALANAQHSTFNAQRSSGNGGFYI
jgi:hypothetical protein